MEQMQPKTRLSLIGLLILGSMVYTALIAIDEEFARTVMLGYIGLILTIFLTVEVWRKP